MERKDREKKPSEGSEKAPQEKENVETRRSLWLRWTDFFKRVVPRTFLAFRRAGSAVRHAYTTVVKPEGDVSPVEDIREAFKHIPMRRGWLGYGLIGAIVAIYFLSGVYTVKPGEEAVTRRFGREIRQQITEGLHYRLPWPIGAIEKVNVMEIRRVDLGDPASKEPILFPKKRQSSMGEEGGHAGHGGSSMASETSSKPQANPGSAENQFLTGDENIIEIRMNIQYRVKDASDYLFKANSPDSLVPYSARVAVTEIFGGMQVDDLLTVAKSRIQKQVAAETQRMLDGYEAGLEIVNVSLQEVNPPPEVSQAFRDVSSAKEEREEKMNKALGYRNTVIPEARGKAHKTISDAEGYMERVVNQARGDADKFSAMLDEYREAKGVTKHRLYLETIEKVLAKAKKFVIDSKKEKVNLKFVK
jgi:membrane protease subunit HflK